MFLWRVLKLGVPPAPRGLADSERNWVEAKRACWQVIVDRLWVLRPEDDPSHQLQQGFEVPWHGDSWLC
jgi:hypothetical protein